VNVNVLLSGRLTQNGYGKGNPQNRDHTYQLAVPEQGTVREVIQGMGIPYCEVAMAMVNGHECGLTAPVRADDRVFLVPPDLVTLWRHLGWMNLGAGSAFGS
jgi:hypothetical protein